jgi:hypothetical protein
MISTFIYIELVGQQTNDIAFEIIGKYEIYGFNMGAILSLYPDSTFNQKISISSCCSEDDVEEITGNYKLENNLIILQPRIRKETNYKTDSRYLKDTLFIVPWKNMIYLLSDKNIDIWGSKANNDILKFIVDVKRNDTSYSNYWKKKSNITYNTDLDSLIPLPWRLHLLPNIIHATIVNVESKKITTENECKKAILTLNKGVNDGVSMGMKFYSEAEFECEIDIFEVDTHTSKGYLLNCDSCSGRSFYAFLIL